MSARPFGRMDGRRSCWKRRNLLAFLCPLWPPPTLQVQYGGHEGGGESGNGSNKAKGKVVSVVVAVVVRCISCMLYPLSPFMLRLPPLTLHCGGGKGESSWSRGVEECRGGVVCGDDPVPILPLLLLRWLNLRIMLGAGLIKIR